MRNVGLTILLLACKRLHDLRLVRAPEELNQRPWFIAALVSWGIAFFEYMLQVPGNRIGYTVLVARPAQAPAGGHHARRVRAVRRVLLREPLKLDYLWAALCILGAVYFVFRSRLAGA